MNLTYRILTLMILTISGNPALSFFPSPVIVLVPALIMILFAALQRVVISWKDLFTILTFVVVFTVHLIMFGASTISHSVAFLLRLLTAYCAARAIPDFPGQLITVMKLLSVMSLLFMLPVWLGVNMAELIRSISIPLEHNDIQPIVSIGIHNYRVEVVGVARTCGIFWEPGAFAGYLVFCMLYLMSQRGVRTTSTFLLFSLTLISTQSTTGYVAFALVLAAYIWRLQESFSPWVRLTMRVSLVGLIPIVIGLGYANVPFLKEKIMDQAETAQSEASGWELTRFGNAVYDYRDIIKRPVFGWSMDNGTRNELNDDILTRQGNGLTGATVRLGMPIIVLFLYSAFSAYLRISMSIPIALIATLTVILLLVGEQFLLYPLFLTLLFRPMLEQRASIFTAETRYEPRSASYMPQPSR